MEEKAAWMEASNAIIQRSEESVEEKSDHDASSLVVEASEEGTRSPPPDEERVIEESEEEGLIDVTEQSNIQDLQRLHGIHKSLSFEGTLKE